MTISPGCKPSILSDLFNNSPAKMISILVASSIYKSECRKKRAGGSKDVKRLRVKGIGLEAEGGEYKQGRGEGGEKVILSTLTSSPCACDATTTNTTSISLINVAASEATKSRPRWSNHEFLSSCITRRVSVRRSFYCWAPCP